MHSCFYLVWQDCGVTSLLAITGLLCKEQGITVLAICCIYELFSQKVQYSYCPLKQSVEDNFLAIFFYKEQTLSFRRAQENCKRIGMY